MSVDFNPGNFLSALSDGEIEELRNYLTRLRAEEDAVDIQCIADGHENRDRAAAARDDWDTGRVVSKTLRPHFEGLLTLEEARSIVAKAVRREVPDEMLRSQYKVLLSEKCPEFLRED